MAVSRDKGATGNWFLPNSGIQGFLCDITGVLFEANEEGPYAIQGSVNAIKRLNEANIPIRFCTNETQCTKAKITEKLHRLGFTMVKPDQVFPPAPAVINILKNRDLRPHLLVYPDLLPEFEGIIQENPNCVVLGDAVDEFSYENINKAFQTLINMKPPILISLGKGRYYKDKNRLQLDVGPYAAALEFACDVKAEVVGKPSSAFFSSALQDMGLTADQAVMIGDDIVSDVGGAQACGIKGVQVRTGKYRAEDEPHPTVTPDGYVDNLAQAVDVFLKHRS